MSSIKTIIDEHAEAAATAGPSNDWQNRFRKWRAAQPEHVAFVAAVAAGAATTELRRLGAAAGLTSNEIAQERSTFHMTKDDRAIVARHHKIVAEREALRVERERLTRQLADEKLSQDETEALEARLKEILVTDRQLTHDGALPRMAWKRLGKPAA